MRKTILTQWGKFKKGGWKNYANEIREIEGNLLVCEDILNNNCLDNNTLFKVITQKFNVINTNILLIKVISDTDARDIVNFTEEIINEAFFGDVDIEGKTIKTVLDDVDINNLKEMIEILKPIGRSKMKDITYIYSGLFGLCLMATPMVKEYELELRKLGINI